MSDRPPPPVTLDDMIAEVRTELAYRRNVFGNAVRTGRMNKRLADRRFDVMEAVLNHLEEERRNGRGTVDER